MEVFRELIVGATAEQMAAAVDQIEQAMPVGWARDKAAETRLRATPVISPRVAYCFACRKTSSRAAALVVLAQRDSRTFHVSNIIPVGRHQLSRAEYNAVLEDFHEKAFGPCADAANLDYSLTGTDAGLARWMPAATEERLREFSTCANKGTGSSHPNDRERWNAFVLSAHQEQVSLDSSTLQRWLVEAEDWPPEIAEQLALEYEYGRELLSFAAVHAVH